MMSAATETIYGFSPPHILKTRSYKLANLAGCDIGKTPGEIVECLRSKDPLSLTELQWSLTEGKLLEFGFKPTIDGKFIDDFPSNIINSGKAKRADLMIGSVENEG
jgi:acetylcholinesterase